MSVERGHTLGRPITPRSGERPHERAVATVASQMTCAPRQTDRGVKTVSASASDGGVRT